MGRKEDIKTIKELLDNANGMLFQDIPTYLVDSGVRPASGFRVRASIVPDSSTRTCSPVWNHEIVPVEYGKD